MCEHLLAGKGRKRKRLFHNVKYFPKLLCWKIAICGKMSVNSVQERSGTSDVTSHLDMISVTPPCDHQSLSLITLWLSCCFSTFQTSFLHLSSLSLLLHLTTHICLIIPFPSDFSGVFVFLIELLYSPLFCISHYLPFWFSFMFGEAKENETTLLAISWRQADLTQTEATPCSKKADLLHVAWSDRSQH